MAKSVILSAVGKTKNKIQILIKYKNNNISMNTFNNNFIIGLNSYFGKIKVVSYTKKEKLIIGEYVSIADEVTFLLGGEHQYNGLSTYPFDKYRFGKREKTMTKGDIVIEDDVWIGYGVLIMSGVTIKQGSIIGAGSVVTKSTEPYGIYGGNPARKIKYRFDKEIIDILLTLDIKKVLDEVNERGIIYDELTINKAKEIKNEMD